MTTPHKPTATADQLAAASGLFNQSKNQPSGIPDGPLGPPSRRSQPAGNSQRKPSDNLTAPKHPRNSQDVDQVEQVLNQGQTDYWTEQAIFRRIKQAITDKLDRRSNSMLLLSSRETAQRIDRLLREADDLRAKLAALTHTPAAIEGGSEPPTRDELIGIISQAVRRPDGTGADIKGLTATLQSLLPDLFRDESNDRKPDPCAVLSYVVSFAGMTGPEIIQSLGGRDFVRDTLVDILKTAVILPDPVQ